MCSELGELCTSATYFENSEDINIHVALCILEVNHNENNQHETIQVCDIR